VTSLPVDVVNSIRRRRGCRILLNISREDPEALERELRSKLTCAA
jgi:hypothetical protein